MISFFRTKGPGVLVSILLALAAVALSTVIPLLGSTTLAIVLGLMLGNLNVQTQPLQAGLKFTEKVLLETAIVLIGFGLNLQVFSQLSVYTWSFVALSVLLVFGFALLVSRWLGLSLPMGALLGAGSAICGSAAIGAVAPILANKEEETGLSIGIINLLSTVALFFLPMLTVFLAMNPEKSGLIIGGVIQSMGHVVGAGFSVNPEVGRLATMVKMGRVLLLIPLLLGLYFMGGKQKANAGKTSFPLFIPLFIGALLLAQLPAFPSSWAKALAELGDLLLLVAMVAIGFKINLKALFTLAGPALLAGVCTFIMQLLLFLAFLYAG